MVNAYDGFPEVVKELIGSEVRQLPAPGTDVTKQNKDMIQLVAAMEQQIAELSKQRRRQAAAAAAAVRPTVADASKQVHERIYLYAPRSTGYVAAAPSI